MDPLQNQNSNPVPAPAPAPAPKPEPISSAPATTQAPTPVQQPARETSSSIPPVSAPTYVPAVESTSHKELRLILPAMLVLLLLAGGYALYRNMTSAPDTAFRPAANTSATSNTPPVDTETSSDTEAPSGDVASATVSLPIGWPAWVPVERGSLKESSKIYYESQTTVLYSAAYTSKKSESELWTLMNSAATKEGFSLDKDANKTNGVYIAKNAEGDTFMVVLSKQEGETLVQVSLLDK